MTDESSGLIKGEAIARASLALWSIPAGCGNVPDIIKLCMQNVG